MRCGTMRIWSASLQRRGPTQLVAANGLFLRRIQRVVETDDHELEQMPVPGSHLIFDCPSDFSRWTVRSWLTPCSSELHVVRISAEKGWERCQEAVAAAS